MMRHAIFWLASLVAVGAVAIGQTTTQPAVAAWSAVADQFTAALLKGETKAASSLATDPITIVRVGSVESIELATLVHHATGGTVLASHIYSFPPLAMAADLAADFKTASQVPDSLKELMIPQDDEGMKRANATAIQWLAQALGAEKGTPVAVVLLLPVTPPDAKAPAVPLLVLIKGDQGLDGAIHVSRVVYGTPQQIID
jgi:hypothetical protein